MLASMLGPGAGSVAAQTPSEAVVAARTNAANNGVTSFISVVDRDTGAVLSQTGNAGAQVASESIMKLFIATYYLWSYGGYTKTPQSVRDRLSYMLRYSDNDIATALFTASAIPTVAANYGLGSTGNATDRVGHWGAARITASDMTRFLFRASKDPKVGPWLIPVMAQTARTGSADDTGFSQYFGLNALSGVHGSKQGWGCDSYWTTPQCAVHSVGYTDRYFVAVLQLGGYPDPMRSTATTSARLIQQSTLPLVDGAFICDSASGAVFRMAGGAPVYVSSWSAMGGPKPCRSMTPSAIDQLPDYPREGTFLRGHTGAVYRIAGGAPIYVSSWAAFGGEKSAVTVDSAAIDRAGSGGNFNHLRAYPADGTFIRGTRNGAAFRVAGGAPIYVSSWAVYGGEQSTLAIDSAAIDNAGAAGRWKHLRALPIEGTFIRSTDGAVYRVAGGAPIRVSTWNPFGGRKPTTIVDPAAVSRAGSGGVWNHLRAVPADGTFVRGGGDGTVFRVAGGAPIVVTRWSAVGGTKPFVLIDSAAIENAGTGGGWDHLRRYPAEGTFLRAYQGGAVYRVAGQAPVYVSTWTAFGGRQPTTDVDAAALNHAGSGGNWDHLRRYPLDGTFLRGTSTGAVFRVAGGAPLYVPSWSAFGGEQPVVDVDYTATSRAGAGGAYNHLRMTPADGTFLRGLPGTRTYRVQGGVAVYVPSWDPFGGPQPFTPVNQPTIDRAGSGGDYNHLLGVR